MITFTNIDKRWLEIYFYLLCRKIFSINQKQQDIINFINGYRWTNMFDCDKLITLITDEKILISQKITPTKQEFLITMEHNDCRLRVDSKSIRELIKETEFSYKRFQVYHAQLKEEINPTEIFPKLEIPKIHETIYSFLLAIRYIADLVKKIKF